jgi:hypothetical protein
MSMPRLLVSVPVFAVLLGLAACADPQMSYTVPSGLTAETGANISGSLVQTGLLTSNEKVYVVSVDNKSVTNPNWQIPVLVSPGLHVLQVLACECGFLTNASGSVSLATNLQPGKNYVVKATVPVSAGIFHPTEANIWVADASGNTASQKTLATITAPPGPVFIPIFLPVK